jgi:hypothetical protein
VWQLVSGDDAWLRGVGEAVLESPGLNLAGSPELAEIRRLLRLADTEAHAAGADQPETESVPETGELPGPRHFAVEVGTFLDETAARGLVRELAGYGFRAYSARSQPGDEDGLSRVRIGPCSSLGAAESLGVLLSQRLMLSYQIVAETAATGEVGAPVLGDSSAPDASPRPQREGTVRPGGTEP